MSAAREGSFEFDLEREAEERWDQHDEGEGERTFDGRIDRDRLDAVGDDQDVQVEQDRLTDPSSAAS